MNNSEVFVRYRLTVPLPVEHRAQDGRLCRLYVYELSMAHGAHLMLAIDRLGEFFIHGYGTVLAAENDLRRTGLLCSIGDRGGRFFEALTRTGKAEQLAGPDTLLVGVGLNVTNRPWTFNTGLEGLAGRLADALDGGVVMESEPLTARVLEAMRRAHESFGKRRLAGFVSRLNRCWGRTREGVLEPAGGVLFGEQRGWFRGINAEGRVRIETAPGEVVAIPAHQIGRLREVG